MRLNSRRCSASWMKSGEQYWHQRSFSNVRSFSRTATAGMNSATGAVSRATELRLSTIAGAVHSNNLRARTIYATGRMTTVKTKVHVEGIGSMPIYDFMMNPTDSNYQRWWPGTHLEFHTLSKSANGAGMVVYMDEYIGRLRLRMTAIVIDAQPGKRITQLMNTLVRNSRCWARCCSRRKYIAFLHFLTLR